MSKTTNPYFLAEAVEKRILADIEHMRTHHDEALIWNIDVLNYLRTIQSSIRLLTVLYTEGKSVGID